MKVLSIKTVNGPSVYHHKPTLVMQLDLEELTEKASCESPEFIQRLLTALPALKEHHCSPGHIGGFVERLNRGTYFAHITEHIALALSEAAGIGVKFGKSVYDGAAGRYKVVIRFKSEEGMKTALYEAVNLAVAFWFGRKYDVSKAVEEIKRSVSRSELGPSTKALVLAAEKRNIPVLRLDELNFVQLGWGKYRKYIQATTTSDTGDIAVAIAQDKSCTKKFLEDASIRVPKGRSVRNVEDAIEAFSEFGPNVVLKPLDGNHGRGVFLDLKTPEEVIEAYSLALKHGESILVEERFYGQDYRVVVVGGQLVAASHRVPAHVIGNGTHSIAELVSAENLNPLRGEGHEKPLTKIFFDDEANLFLKKKNILLTNIPPAGEIVYLRETANISTGGSADDVTDEIHPDIRLMCERAARAVGLDVCGIDLILEDIRKPLEGQRGGIIEVNAGPGIRMHHYPRIGKARDVGAAIIDNMFKENHDGRIPVISITGTNGKTTVTRVISHILTQAGQNVGTTTTDGIYFNGQLISKGDNTGPISARTILSDPMVDTAVLETARGGIVRRGLAFDWCDVGVITNIQPDHIGQDGIESIDDILWIKALVIERVRKGGTIVLNADSKELVSYVTEKSHLLNDDRKLVYFSMDDNNPILMEHAHKGGVCFFHRNGGIYQMSSDTIQLLLKTSEIPMTMGGTSLYQIANAMASIASAVGVGIPMEQALEGLCSFSNLDNPGRTNLYKVNKGFVLLDYGHNPEALISVGEMVHQWSKHVTGVIAAPGDRSDEMIALSGIAAAHAFDKVIIREDLDLRGRRVGEVSRIVADTMAKESKTPYKIVIDADEALKTAIREMRSGEVVVYFYEHLKEVTEYLSHIGAKPVASFEELAEEKEHVWGH